jgi:hypothetical protein
MKIYTDKSFFGKIDTKVHMKIYTDKLILEK